jgi:hypothetical protein
MSALMYFATGDGGNAIGESYTAPSDRLYSIHPISATTLDLVFNNGNDDFDSIRLTIVSNTHKTVINAINNAINQSYKSLIAICDSDNSSFIDSNITDCVISLGGTTTVANISGIEATELIDINTRSTPIKSISLANTHSADVAVDLYLKNAGGTDYYLLDGIVIPVATTLVLDKDDVNYDIGTYNLYIKLSVGSMGVIIKNN